MKNIKLSLNVRFRKLWVISAIFIVSIFFFYLTQQPAKGTVKMLLPSDVNEPKKEEASLLDKARQQFSEKAIKIGEEEARGKGYSSYNGKYISFQYPNSYELKTNESSSSGILEKVILLGAGISPRKVAVTATKMTNTDSVEDISGVQMRRLKPKIYQEKPLDISGKKGILFEKKENGYEKTAFFLADQIAVTIALTSVNRDSALDTDFDLVLKELRARY